MKKPRPMNSRERGALEAVYDGLAEYYPSIELAHVRKQIEEQVKLRDTGNDQSDYEDLRDQVEKVVKSMDTEEEGMTRREISQRLQKARAKFEAVGGRDVDLAEEIDHLEAELEKRPKGKEPKKELKPMIYYFRQIIRNACLYATQPEAKVYSSLSETPPVVLAKMVVTLKDAFQLVNQAFERKTSPQKLGIDLRSELLGLKAALDAVEFPPSTKNRKKCPRIKQGPGRA